MQPIVLTPTTQDLNNSKYRWNSHLQEYAKTKRESIFPSFVQVNIHGEINLGIATRVHQLL